MAGPRQAELTEDQLRIGRALRLIRRGIAMQRLRERLYGEAPVVLDVGQHDALDAVIALGEARMSDVAAGLRVDPSTATRTVARLERAGLVERRRAADDARAVVVTATPSGVALHEAFGAAARTAMRELYEGFTPDEQAQLADLLDRLVAGLDGLAGLPPPAVSD